MRKLEGVFAAGCLFLFGLPFVLCSVFSGGDLDPAVRGQPAWNFILIFKACLLLIALGFLLAGIMALVFAWRIKERPAARSSRLRLARYYLESKNRKIR